MLTVVSITTVTRWRRYGKDRLYVTDAAGLKVGWFDLVADQPHPETPMRLGELAAAVQTWQATDIPVAATALAGLQKQVETPAPAVAATGPVLSALGVASAPPADPHILPVAPAAEWNDLAEQRAGALAREQAVALKQAAPVRTFLARALGVHTDERAWRIGADGEEKVAAQLRKLQSKDPRWHVLHAVPVGENGSDIDHVVIGPGGVFTLNAKHHPGAKIWVAGNTVMVNGQRQPYVRNSAHEARRAGRLLSAVCGFPVTAVGVVVPVGAEDVVIKTPPEEVHVIYRRALTQWLRERPGVVSEVDIARIYAAARRSTTWRAVKE